VAKEVKDRPRSPERVGISRHLEGWQPGLLAVVIAAIAALLGVPHAVPPDALPLPSVDFRECKRAEAADVELARRAVAEPLPFETRAVGEAFRRFGESNSAQNTGLAADRLAEVRERARVAMKVRGVESLQRLLALQTEMFMDVLVRWEHGEDVETQLSELGGNFLAKARSSHWLRAERQLDATPSERRVLFRVRWVDITGLRDQPTLAPTANEWRVYYRFLLLHPEHGDVHLSAEAQLRYVSVIEKVDLDYPAAFARGVLYYRMGLFAKSEAAFHAELERPDGPWRLRARNHMLAAAERAKERSPDLFAE
jgi:hypothetical protein